MSREPDEIAEIPSAGEPARDGIGEEDNPIPGWWWWSFVATVVFAVAYIPYYTLSGWSQERQYQAEVAVARARAEAARAALPDTNPYRGQVDAIAEGKQVFLTICAACHKPDATGLVGPSLVDPYWKYGHTDRDLFETVSGGRPGGMPAWASQLGTEKIWKALAYLETLPRTSEPGLGSPGFAGPAVPAPGS